MFRHSQHLCGLWWFNVQKSKMASSTRSDMLKFNHNLSLTLTKVLSLVKPNHMTDWGCKFRPLVAKSCALNTHQFTSDPHITLTSNGFELDFFNSLHQCIHLVHTHAGLYHLFCVELNVKANKPPCILCHSLVSHVTLPVTEVVPEWHGWHSLSVIRRYPFKKRNAADATADKLHNVCASKHDSGGRGGLEW